MVAMRRPEPNTGAIVEPQAPPSGLPLRNLPPLLAPDPLHPFMVDLEPLTPQKSCDPTVAVTAVGLGKPYNLSPQIGLIIPLRTTLPLGGPGLTDYPTDTPLGNAQLPPDVFHAAPAPVGT
jgi:hypothetical protein